MSAPTRRTFSATAKSVAPGVYDVTLSTSSVDREHDRIEATGWKVPTRGTVPLLWQHDANQLPLGRVAGLHVAGDALRGRMTFTPRGLNPFADQVADLIDAGVLTDVSVGFRPLEQPKSNREGGLTFTKQELLELSVVNVPAHPEARIEASTAAAVCKWFADGGDDNDGEEVAVVFDTESDEEIAVVFDDTDNSDRLEISDEELERVVREGVAEAWNRFTGRVD